MIRLWSLWIVKTFKYFSLSFYFLYTICVQVKFIFQSKRNRRRSAFPNQRSSAWNQWGGENGRKRGEFHLGSSSATHRRLSRQPPEISRQKNGAKLRLQHPDGSGRQNGGSGQFRRRQRRWRHRGAVHGDVTQRRHADAAHGAGEGEAGEQGAEVDSERGHEAGVDQRQRRLRK